MLKAYNHLSIRDTHTVDNILQASLPFRDTMKLLSVLSVNSVWRSATVTGHGLIQAGH